MIRAGFLILAATFAAFSARAEEATVAVAANFLTTAETLAAAYEAATGDRIVLAHGSTGRLYAQIANGAPFDVFLAADAARPAALEEAGRSAARQTYALGQLVLVARTPLDDPAEAMTGRTVALADPAVAPYGVAAVEVLQRIGATPGALVHGDSVGQVAALFTTGNAEMAFLAASQLPLLGDDIQAARFDGLYAPIVQDAVLLDRGTENAVARGFFDYLAGPAAAEMIRAAGYGVPE